MNLDQRCSLLDAILQSATEAIVVLDPALRILVATHAFYRLSQAAPSSSEEQFLYEVGTGKWNIPSLREVLGRVGSSGVKIQDFEIRHHFPQVGPKVMLVNARRIEPQPG